MEKKKIKVFLSGIVNSTNAQNLNCLALLRHLDPDKFEVRALTVYSGNLPQPQPSTSTSTYPIRYPAKIWHPIQLMRGILWSDVAYLCKPEYWRFQRLLVNVLRKKCFGTIESIYEGIVFDRAIDCLGSVSNVIAYHQFPTCTYAITKFMIERNRVAMGLPEPMGVLYLGNDFSEFFTTDKVITKLTDAILIGADLKRKGIDEYLFLATKFPQVAFHVVGGGVGDCDYCSQCKNAGLSNVFFHGRLNRSQLKNLMRRVQLHIFTSKFESFGKVTFETAAAGIPSVVYGCYGAREWMHSDELDSSGQWNSLPNADGYVVDDFSQMQSAIRDLLDHPEKLRLMSENARKLARDWDWSKKISSWEDAIEFVYERGSHTCLSFPDTIRSILYPVACLKNEIASFVKRIVGESYDFYKCDATHDFADPQFIRISDWQTFRESMIARQFPLYAWQKDRFLVDGSCFVALITDKEVLSYGWEAQKARGMIGRYDIPGRNILYDFVTPIQHRGRGYYTRLLHHLVSESNCLIYVKRSNFPSVRTIRKVGFTKYAVGRVH